MPASYLTTARKFATENEENELNELTRQDRSKSPYARKAFGNEKNEVNEETPQRRVDPLTSLNSFTARRIHKAKVSILSGQGDHRGDLWCVSILAGIRYAKEGRVNPDVIQEDIEVWKDLAAHHGWPAPPLDLVSNNELNEFNEERRSA